MKYFGYLTRFVIAPLVTLRFLLWLDQQRAKQPPDHLQNWPENAVLLGHVVTAVAYTTAWDNYLVASKIWSYDPKLVTGHTIGYVPIEEYSFFVLQSLLTGSLTQYLSHHMELPKPEAEPANMLLPRLIATAGLGTLWSASVYGLLRGGPQTRYLNLILGWALPPIMFQTAFGGDILWRNRKLLATALLPTTAYLGYTDSLAIQSGTWTINPENTIGKEVIKHLPFEEFLFFLLTNVLLVFGITLVQSKDSESRLPRPILGLYYKWKSRILSNQEETT